MCQRPARSKSSPSHPGPPSRHKLLGELVEQRPELSFERGVGSTEAAVADERFELEVVWSDRQRGGEVVFDAVEPGELVVGESAASLGLLGEPVLETLLDREWIGDELAVGYERVAHERHE